MTCMATRTKPPRLSSGLQKNITKLHPHHELIYMYTSMPSSKTPNRNRDTWKKPTNAEFTHRLCSRQAIDYFLISEATLKATECIYNRSLNIEAENRKILKKRNCSTQQIPTQTKIHNVILDASCWLIIIHV